MFLKALLTSQLLLPTAKLAGPQPSGLGEPLSASAGAVPSAHDQTFMLSSFHSKASIQRLVSYGRQWGSHDEKLLTDTAVRVAKQPIILLSHAAGVARLASSVVVAVAPDHGAGEVTLLDHAGADNFRVAGVEHNLVPPVQVPAFVDVDLAVRGPVGPNHPEGGPGTAYWLGEVGEVGDEQAPVVLLGTLKPDTAPAVILDVLRVDADLQPVVGVLDQLLFDCVGLVLVLDVPIVVILGGELELVRVEEVGRGVFVLDRILLQGGDARGICQGGSAQADERWGHVGGRCIMYNK